MRSRRSSLTAVLLAIAVLLVSAPAGARDPQAIKVMTRNQYIGTDLAPVILAADLPAFLAAATAALTQVAANNFPLRAQALALEVFLTRPDVIGLQEVFNLTVDGANLGPPFVDHLQVTLAALAALGLEYEVAGTIENLDVSVPLELNNQVLVRVLDRDVILVKRGLPYTTLRGDHGDGGLCGVSIPVPPLVLQSTPSQDGCTYTVVAVVSSPLGSLAIKRGFLGVDVRVNGKKYRVVNTHLEVKELEPIIQSLQAVELAATLEATTPPGRTLITLGDFNSSPVDDGPITPPYQVMVGAGLADAWDTNLLAFLNPDGFTCCQQADLANTSSLLSERIDLVFVRTPGSFESLALVTGRVPLATTPHWASDHGGVVGTLIFSR